MVRNRYSLKYARNGSRIRAEIGNTRRSPETAPGSRTRAGNTVGSPALRARMLASCETACRCSWV